MNKKTIFFDIDGTLINYDTTVIQDDVINAIQKLKNDGHNVVIATGRAYPNAKLFIDELGLTDYITSDGQYVVSNSEVIYKTTIDDTLKDTHIKKLQSYNFEIGVENNDGLMLERSPRCEKTKKILLTQGFKVKVSDDILQYNDVFNIWVFGDDASMQKFEKKNFPQFRAIEWHPNQIQIVLKTESKATGIYHYINKYNIKIEDTYAFGDGENDVEMFNLVSFPIAMQNAIPHLKESACYITDHVKDSGVITGLRHFKFID